LRPLPFSQLALRLPFIPRFFFSFCFFFFCLVQLSSFILNQRLIALVLARAFLLTYPFCINQYHSHLQLEVLRWIASHLQDNRHALHACLLVSRAWSQAAVEYLYKAEHMMGDYDFRSFSSVSVATLAFEGLTLEDDPVTLASLGSPRNPLGSAAMVSSNKESADLSMTMVPLQQFSTQPHRTRNDLEGFRSEALSRLLLKRTLDASLLHDAQCSYDYISYLNKVSCPVRFSLSSPSYKNLVISLCGSNNITNLPRLLLTISCIYSGSLI
jgi:hypothetical protein